MPQFASDQMVELGPVRLLSEQVRGKADVVAADGAALARDLGRIGVPDAGADALLAGLAGAGGRLDHAVPLSELRVTGDRSAVSLEIEPPRKGEAQLLLEVDDAGLLRWHLPEQGEPLVAVQPLERFRIPVERLVSLDIMRAAGGVVDALQRKVLHVVRFPVQDVGELFVQEWEEQFRPYGIAIVTPETLLEPIDGRRLTGEQWASLDGKPALLLLHGTFSRARDAFHGLAEEKALLAELSRRYEGRVIAFDHPTLHVGPERNVEFFRGQVPDGVELVLDVLAHSRGGLVARHLAREPRFNVRKTVHVATPNAGTPLAGPQRIHQFLDTFTNLLVLVPVGPVDVLLSGVVEVLKQLATGVAQGLDGLAAMDPDGAALRTLNASPAGSLDCAIASDFQATPNSALLVLDQLVDGFFEAANDLIVPTAGVAGTGRFIIAQSHTVPVGDAVQHNGFFGSGFVRERLAAHLTAAP